MDFKARTSEEKKMFLRKPWHHWKEREVWGKGQGIREEGRKETEKRGREGKDGRNS